MAGRKPGTPKTGGRQKGTPNKATKEVIAKLEEMGCDPIEGMARIAMGDADCFVCRDGRVSSAQFFKIAGVRSPSSWADLPDDELEERQTADMTCPVCGGTGKDPVDTKQRADMFKELAQYVAPKRKAIEMDGTIAVESFDEWAKNLKR